MSFSQEKIDLIWEKGITIPGYDKSRFRKDCCGAWIIKKEYGNRNSDFGWEIDHIYPQNLGGGDDDLNLRPMQWQNNDSKKDDYPAYFSVIRAQGVNNIEFQQQLTVNSKTQADLKKLYNIK